MAAKKPCDTCTRVFDPRNCENKTCRVWQKWFLQSWEDMRQHCARIVEESKRRSEDGK